VGLWLGDGLSLGDGDPDGDGEAVGAGAEGLPAVGAEAAALEVAADGFPAAVADAVRRVGVTVADGTSVSAGVDGRAGASPAGVVEAAEGAEPADRTDAEPLAEAPEAAVGYGARAATEVRGASLGPGRASTRPPVTTPAATTAPTVSSRHWRSTVAR
jgi:hypothetical protein